MSPEPALVIDRLTKDFAVGLRGFRLRAVDRLSLRIAAGEVVGLLGPNGAGKSTVLKVALDLLAPTAGECRIFGVSSRRREARRPVGYLPESPGFPRHLTGRELVSYQGALAGLSGLGLRTRVEEELARTGLAEAGARRVGTYSKGMLQRLGLAQALVHGPRLLLLDEPASGIDGGGSGEMVARIRQLKAAGCAMLVVFHESAQMAEICDRVALMERGRLVAERVLLRPAATIPAP
ncbi:MAG TPA: ABC transporter ATP-binding protein [Opitutaceae bacterium]|nr:ABC transporter ATP-binding protein [Opitutaceae bacterium]